MANQVKVQIVPASSIPFSRVRGRWNVRLIGGAFDTVHGDSYHHHQPPSSPGYYLRALPFELIELRRPVME